MSATVRSRLSEQVSNMPCDHTDYDGSDCGSSHADSLEPFRRVSTNGFTNDKDSSASPMRHSSDKGKPACLFSHNPSLSSESPSKKKDCHSPNYHKGDNSSNAEHQLPTHGSNNGHKDFAEVETNSLTNDNNSPLALTTNNIDDEGRMSDKDSHQIKQRDSSRLAYCLRDYRDPVSMSDLSLDKPKASISPGAETDRKGMPSPHSMTANIPLEMQQNVKHAFAENEGYHNIVGDMKRALHYNKASSPAGHSSMLYNFLHGAASREHYSGSEYSFDNTRHRSKVYTNFNGSSSLAPPYINSSWDSDVNMKSPPQLVSYLSQHDMMAERSRLRRCSIDEGSHLSSPFDLSQGKSNVGDFEGQYSSKTTMVKSEPSGARESSIFQSSHPPSMSLSSLTSSSLTVDKAGTNEDGKEPNDNGTHFSSRFGFVVKKENESSPRLSPGALSRHNLSSPYASHSLSPWSNCGDFGHASDNRDTPIKDKVKCASDSNLYFPTVIHAPLSPSLSSITSKEGNEAIECRWKMCTETFCSQKALAQHVNDSHVRIERPDVNFQCHWHGCPRQGNGFNARYKMLIHIRTHTNEKPHKCAVCQKCFSRLENLKIHMRSHTGEKPYACMFPGCTKAYSNSSDRFKHVRTHQEEKPYKCKMEGCHKQYTDPSSLRKHVRTHGHGIKSVQAQLRRTVSEGDEIQHSDNMFGGKDQRSGLFSRHSIDFQADFNKGSKRSADRDRDLSYDMDTGQHDMMDIQRNVELYSSLEVKNGIQKFEEVENLIRDDFQQTDLTRVAQQAPEMANERRFPGDGDYNQTTPSHSKPLLLSVPSIVIEEADDSVKSRQGDDNSVASERDLDESKFCHSRIKRKRFDVEEELHPNSSGVEEEAEDLRRGGKYSKNEVTGQSTSGLGEVIPSTSQCLPVVHKSTASPLKSSSSSPSYPKHWKKRKIFDEERLQQEKQHQQQQRDEDEEKGTKEAVQTQSEEKSKRHLSHDTLYEGMTTPFRPSPELNTSTHLLRSPDSRSLNLSSPFSVSPTRSFESLASPSSVGSNARPLLSPSSRFPLSSPSTSYFPPTSLYCSSLFPCSYSPASNHHHTPAFMPPSSYFGGYPELHSTHHNFPSSKLDNSSLSSAAAVFFPKAPEACSQLYVPYLSALMDFSSGLDPMSHHHHLSPITLTHHHRAIDPATSSMIYHPMVCPPITRTLP